MISQENLDAIYVSMLPKVTMLNSRPTLYGHIIASTRISFGPIV
jgi:hypothetical protein